MPPAPQPKRHHYVLIVALLILTAVAFVAQMAYFGQNARPVAQTRTDIPPNFPQDAPTPTTADAVDAQKGFDYLVSYTDRGFEPKELTVKKGEAVRFTNNSSAALALQSDEGTQTIAARAYVEKTFGAAGTVTLGDSRGAIFTLTIK